MKPRVVIDTNIYINALAGDAFSPAKAEASRQALSYVDDGHYVPVISAGAVRELTRVYLRPRYDYIIPRSVRRDYLRHVMAAADYIQINPHTEVPACPDPDDVHFLHAAKQRMATYLLTEDYAHVGALGRVDKTLIVKPDQFLLLEQQGARLGLTTPTKVVATDQPDLLRQGRSGSTVFLTRAQSTLVKEYEIEEVPTIPIYSAHKGHSPEGYLLVTNNPDLLAREAFTAGDKLGVTVLSTRQYAQLQNVFSTDPAEFAQQVKLSPQQPTMKVVQSFIAGQRLRHGG